MTRLDHSPRNSTRRIPLESTIAIRHTHHAASKPCSVVGDVSFSTQHLCNLLPKMGRRQADPRAQSIVRVCHKVGVVRRPFGDPHTASLGVIRHPRPGLLQSRTKRIQRRWWHEFRYLSLHRPLCGGPELNGECERPNDLLHTRHRNE